MDFYRVVENHVSIRSYKKKSIAPEALQRILQAATRASSSGNMQAYSIIVTESKRIKQELLEAHFYQPMVLEAPMLLTFCADFHRMRRWLKLSKAADNFDNFMSFMIAAIDAILASQNAALAAEAEGLGICYMGTTLASCESIAKILRCPEGVVPVVGFAMGTPNELPARRDRLPIEALVHRETYQQRSDAEIQAAYRNREKTGWERYMQDPFLRRKVEESKVKNLAQIYTQLKYTKESHEKYSESVLRCLRAQNFFKEV